MNGPSFIDRWGLKTLTAQEASLAPRQAPTRSVTVHLVELFITADPASSLPSTQRFLSDVAVSS